MDDGNRSRVTGWFRNFGPAWLVMMTDIDIASIITALQAGSTWGYRMVFIMLMLTLPLFLIQDAAGRLGTASGVGLGEAIGKFFGRRATIIGGENKDAAGRSLSGAMKSSVERMRTWDEGARCTSRPTGT
jgi:hypothetical protein